MKPRELLRAVVIALATIAAAQAWSQGPETYATPHLFALPNATPTRLFGMGGILSCVPDAGLANPAFAGALDAPHARLLHSITHFDGGLELKGTQLSINTPIGRGDQGIQLAAFSLDHSRGGFNTPAGQLEGTLTENDISVMYGRRCSQYWLVGVGLSPVLHTTTNVYDPLTGTLVSHQDSSVKLGARLGGLYQFEPDGFAGLILDWYTEDVNMSSVAMPQPFSGEFKATTLALGVSGRLSERLLGAIEWAELKTKSGSLESTASGWRTGVEYAATDNLDARVGLNDGGLSLGLGYQGEGWSVDYAYLGGWHDDAVGAVFGGSDTHQVEVTATWQR